MTQLEWTNWTAKKLKNKNVIKVKKKYLEKKLKKKHIGIFFNFYTFKKITVQYGLLLWGHQTSASRILPRTKNYPVEQVVETC